MKAIKQQYQQPLQFTSASGSPTGLLRQDELDSDKIRLMRIARVQINSSVSKHGHRFYVADVTRRATSAYIEPSRYELEFRHSTLRLISSQIRHKCSAFSSQCAACGDMVDILSHGHIEPSVMQQCLPHKMRYSRVEKFLTTVLTHTVTYAVPNAPTCAGCDGTVRALADVFKEKYFESCGLI